MTQMYLSYTFCLKIIPRVLITARKQLQIVCLTSSMNTQKQKTESLFLYIDLILAIHVKFIG